MTPYGIYGNSSYLVKSPKHNFIAPNKEQISVTLLELVHRRYYGDVGLVGYSHRAQTILCYLTLTG